MFISTVISSETRAATIQFLTGLLGPWPGASPSIPHAPPCPRSPSNPYSPKIASILALSVAALNGLTM